MSTTLPGTVPGTTASGPARPSFVADLAREARLLLRERGAVLVCAVLLALAATSVGLGLAEVARQEAAIERFRTLDAEDRAAALAATSDWGGAAYAAFHATWDPPAPLAFAALGQRDVSPWMLRVRMLALEGQIHEADTGNPELALAGRFDLSFVAAFVLPLALVLLLHDLVAREREQGRLPLLVATAGDGRRLWAARIGVRAGAAALALLLPFWVGAGLAGVPAATTALATGALLAAAVLWTLLLLPLVFRPWPATVIATAGVGLWVALALVVPLAGRLVTDALVPAVAGADVAFVQREAVNDAWDLPKATTMNAFFETHPQWADTAPVEQPFHWKWYFAFQQVGDETAAALSRAYREAIADRDRLAGRVAWLSPSIAVQRALQRLAETDVAATLRHDARIRAYHGRLRAFWYPLLFDEPPFERARLEDLPAFAPARG
jgi:ABC-2 type transport system permease protein